MPRAAPFAVFAKGAEFDFSWTRGFACTDFDSIQRQPIRPDVVAVELTPKQRIRYTLRLSLRGR
jgi:hypothetical protein